MAEPTDLPSPSGPTEYAAGGIARPDDPGSLLDRDDASASSSWEIARLVRAGRTQTGEAAAGGTAPRETKLYPHQSLGCSRRGGFRSGGGDRAGVGVALGTVMVRAAEGGKVAREQERGHMRRLDGGEASDGGDDASSLPREHYPTPAEDSEADRPDRPRFVRYRGPTNDGADATEGSAPPPGPDRLAPCATASFEGIPAASPVRSGPSRDDEDELFASRSVLDPSANSLADALVSRDEAEGWSDDDDDASDESGGGSSRGLSAGGYSADRSSFDLAARPVGSGMRSTAAAEPELASPAGASGEEGRRRRGFGPEREAGASSASTKPFIPRTFPSLLDSSASSSYSTAPTHPSPSFDDAKREGSEEEREAASPAGLVEEPLAVEAPPPPDSGYVVDLERINEESSGNDPEASAASEPGPGGRDAPGAATALRAGAGVREPRGGGRTTCGPGNPKPYSETRSEPPDDGGGRPTGAARDPSVRPRAQDQNIHRRRNRFFDYRHQYYTEQYHYFDDKPSPASRGDDDTESTCSSVTLSQAFQPSMRDDDSYASSSAATESTPHPSLSTVSSVTLSRALSVERHDHSDQGFYVAVRLGDYVEGPSEGTAPEAAREEERDIEETERKLEAGSKADAVSRRSAEASAPSVASPGAADAEVSSDAPAPSASTKQIAQSEGAESDILNMLIPECGVPIPSVMAKMGKKSKGGMLLPWHSTRSIQNYQYGGGRRKKRTGRSDSSIFSISSVHTFRG